MKNQFLKNLRIILIMSKLIIGICVYNEEHRFLEKCLKNMREITDNLIIIDDGSTDNSYNIAAKYATELFQTNHWYNENESKLRMKLWNECSKIGEEGDYIFINDADEIFTKNSTEHFQEEFEKAIYLNAEGIGFYRYEMWNETQYRHDGKLWFSGICIRCAKLRKNFPYLWKNWKIHGGSIPLNSYTNYYPAKLQLQHWAYSTPELRAEKIRFYNQYDPGKRYEVKGRYGSILEKNLNLIDFKDFYE